MINASGHQRKVKMSGGETRVNKNTFDISSIKRVTRKFPEVSGSFSLYFVVVQNNGKKMYNKSVLHV